MGRSQSTGWDDGWMELWMYSSDWKIFQSLRLLRNQIWRLEGLKCLWLLFQQKMLRLRVWLLKLLWSHLLKDPTASGTMCSGLGGRKEGQSDLSKPSRAARLSP